MTIRTEYAHGTPSWVDLSTTDTDAAKAFYGELFGWSFEENETDTAAVYIMARKGEHAAAGIMAQPAEMAEAGVPPMWQSYVTVDDLDATMAKVEAAGGQVMQPPFDVMDAGRMSVIGDPTGAVVCFWEAKEHIGAEVVNEHGAVTWNELITPDIDAVKAFFAAVLGWGTEEMDMGGMTYTIWTVEGEQVGGGMPPPMDGMPPHWGVYFNVGDCDGAVATAKAAGGTVLTEPFDSPPGRMAHVADPQGAALGLIQPPAEA